MFSIRPSPAADIGRSRAVKAALSRCVRHDPTDGGLAVGEEEELAATSGPHRLATDHDVPLLIAVHASLAPPMATTAERRAPSVPTCDRRRRAERAALPSAGDAATTAWRSGRLPRRRWGGKCGAKLRGAGRRRRRADRGCGGASGGEGGGGGACGPGLAAGTAATGGALARGGRGGGACKRCSGGSRREEIAEQRAAATAVQAAAATKRARKDSETQQAAAATKARQEKAEQDAAATRCSRLLASRTSRRVSREAAPPRSPGLWSPSLARGGRGGGVVRRVRQRRRSLAEEP